MFIELLGGGADEPLLVIERRPRVVDLGEPSALRLLQLGQAAWATDASMVNPTPKTSLIFIDFPTEE